MISYIDSDCPFLDGSDVFTKRAVYCQVGDRGRERGEVVGEGGRSGEGREIHEGRNFVLDGEVTNGRREALQFEKTKILIQGEVGKGEGERVEGLPEVFSKSKVGKRMREKLDRLVEILPESEVGEGGRKIVYLAVEQVSQFERLEGRGEIINWLTESPPAN